MKKSCAISFLTGMFLIAVISAQGANCNSQNGTVGTPSNFNTNGTWSCNAVPGSGDNITVSHYVTRTGNLTFQWSTQTITINSGGYLKIVGDLTLNGANHRIIINNGGTLEVTGTLTLETGGPPIDVESGGTLKVGTMQINAGGAVTVKTGASAQFTTLNVGNASTAVFTNNGTTTAGTVSAFGINTNTGTMTVTGDLTLQSNGSATFSNSGTLNVGNDLTTTRPFTNTSTGVINVTRDLIVTSSGSASMITTGRITVGRNASSGNTFRVNPTGYVYVTGNFTTTSNESLTVGTDVAPTPYADMVINGDLISNDSGDVRVKDNGRLAIFGGFTKSTNNGGVTMTVESLGQVYLHNQMNFAGAGGGNNIINQNSPTSYGFYYDGGTPSNGTIPANTPNSTDMQTTNPTFYNWIATQAGNPFNVMPITLTYFRAGLEQSNGILLEWATAMEKNFDHFEIQSSKNGIEFEVIASLKGKGHSSVLTRYDYLHLSPVSGRNYYRLKSIDIDGTYEYSSVILANWNGSINGISVYPNPVTDRKIIIAIDDGTNQTSRVILNDPTGKMVWETSIVTAITDFELPANFNSGAYLLTFITGTEKRVIRLLVK